MNARVSPVPQDLIESTATALHMRWCCLPDCGPNDQEIEAARTVLIAAMPRTKVFGYTTRPVPTPETEKKP